MKTLNPMVVVGCCMTLSISSSYVKGEGGFDWMPAQINEQGLSSQDFGGEQIIPEITITETPKPTADISKYTKVYTLELEKFNISNDGTNPDETSKGINAALQHAKKLGANRIVFPKGTYLISEKKNTGPIVFDHKNTVIDLNGATLQMNANGLGGYAVVEITAGTENFRITNGTLRGDKDKHDFSRKGTHEWGHCLVVNGGDNLEIDHLILSNGTGDGVSTAYSGTRLGKAFTKIAYYIYPRHVEQGAFSDKGVKINSNAKTRTAKAYDLTKCNGEFEFGFAGGFQGYPFIRGRVYQAYFYDKDMKFIEMKKCLQFRKVTTPKGAKFAHFEFNQSEVSEEPAHIGGLKGSYIGTISNFTPAVDVHFHHNKLIGNRRLGMAYCGGQRWLIEENLFEGNGGTNPSYGIDLEDGMEFMQDVVIRNNRFKNNKMGDMIICAGSELLIEDNIFEKNVTLLGRPHNYTFRNNKFTGGNVGYKTRTGIAKIHDNIYQNCTVSIVFDTRAVADGLYRKPGQTVATPPLTLANETMINVKKVTGTYFDFKNAKLKNTHLVAGKETRMVNLNNCMFKDSSLKYETEGPDVHFTTKDCKGELEEQGPGLKRKKLN